MVIAVATGFDRVRAAVVTDATEARAAQVTRAAASEFPQLARRSSQVRAEGDRLGLSRTNALSWLRLAPRGLFIHIGPSSRLAAPSDIQWAVKVGWLKSDPDAEPSLTPDAQRAASAFRLNRRGPATWIAAARAVGASYLTVTVKHQDGFCLWPSTVTSWDVDKENDVLRIASREAALAGLRLFVYYSLVDLRERLYARDRKGYFAFVSAQMRELFSGYGPLAGVWFDVPQEVALSDAELRRLYALVHRLQPWALIGTNRRHGEAAAGEDFAIWEETFPTSAPPAPALPQQSAFKLGRTWFWSGRAEPTNPTRLRELTREARRRRTSLLVDVAPRPDGVIPAAVVRAVRQAR
jgi:alpha-L-fucosidase